MKNILDTVITEAKRLKKRIVFPETHDPRTLKAIAYIQKNRIAEPILIGDKKTITTLATKHRIRLSPKTIYIDHLSQSNEESSLLEKKHFENFSKELFQLRKDKGLTLEQAQNLMKLPDYFGCMMLRKNEADGVVSGATSHSSDLLHAIFQVIGTKEKFHKVSGVFFMVFRKRLLIFADCSVIVEPSAHDLADIAIDTAQTASRFGITPRVAFLSFSTHGSSKHTSLDVIREATALTRHRAPGLMLDGEIQLDAAIMPEVARIKCPESPLKGRANILIFPNLNSANIAYKLCERLAKAHAIGPILQGLRKPVNDLSRGCSWQDIVYTTAFTACESKPLDKTAQFKLKKSYD